MIDVNRSEDTLPSLIGRYHRKGLFFAYKGKEFLYMTDVNRREKSIPLPIDRHHRKGADCLHMWGRNSYT